MPPRKGPRNIVSSGSAGNSSKSKPKAVNPDDIPDGPPRPPPLFPLGYKTPIQLLNEKCRKAGWENPSVTSHPNRGGGGADGAQTYTATVTLKKRRNKNAMDFDTVRFVPVPPIEQTDAALARHFGATYALFRVSYYGSGVQPGPSGLESSNPTFSIPRKADLLPFLFSFFCSSSCTSSSPSLDRLVLLLPDL
jgi:hypothetical protein